jgi:hypothetical protein
VVIKEHKHFLTIKLKIMKIKKIPTMIVFLSLILINCSISISQTQNKNVDLQEKEIIETRLIPISEHQNSEKLIKAFSDWEQVLIENSIHDYVSKTDCENFDKMMVLYENGKYPMHSDVQNVIEVDFNQDKIIDYIVSYTLSNCVKGSGWSDDFIFIQSTENGELIIRKDLTMDFKKKYAEFLKNNFEIEIKKEDNYIETKGVEFISFENNEIFGKINIADFSYKYEKKGNFIYNFKTNEFLANNNEF